jgi:small subunit ribosomal protein S15
MARIYSGKKGRSGSKRPPIKIVPKWLNYKKEDVEKLVVELAKQKYDSGQVGLILRNQYGIPDVKTITKKTISEIIKEHKLYPEIPEDLLRMLKKAVSLREHLLRYKRDMHSKRGLENLEAKIRRLGKYYSRTGKLPSTWKYSAEEAKLIVQK